MKPLRIAIMYGSQTGNAQAIAEGLHEGCKERGLDSSLLKCDAWKKMTPELKEWSAVVFVVSTTGNGDPPENAERFWRFLKRRSHPNDLLGGLPFALLGLGDTNYDKFCYMGKSLYKRLRDLSAVPFHAPAFADEATNMEETIEPWTESLYQCLEALRSGGGGIGMAHGTAKAEAYAEPKESGALALAQEGLIPDRGTPPQEAAVAVTGPLGEISPETPSSVPTPKADGSVAPHFPVVAISSVTTPSLFPGSNRDGVVIPAQGVSAAATKVAQAQASLATPRVTAEGVSPTPAPVSALTPALETLRGVGERQDPGTKTPLPDHRIAVMYGSQTGNAQSIAERIHQSCKERGFNATLLACDGWKKMTPGLTELTALVFVVSTTGNGNPPENMERFWRFLKRRSQPKDLLQGMPFALLGLGDTNYDKFCYMGKSLDKRLRELGAAPFHSPAFADEATNMEETVEPWIKTLFPALEVLIALARVTVTDAPTGVDSERTIPSPDDPEASAAAAEAACTGLASPMTDVPGVGKETVTLAEAEPAVVTPGEVSAAREAIEPDHQTGGQTENDRSPLSAKPPSDLGAEPVPVDIRVEERYVVPEIDPTEAAIKEAAAAAAATATAAFGAGSVDADPGFAVETLAAAETLAGLGLSESTAAPVSGMNGDLLEGIDQASALEGASPPAAPWSPRGESGAKPLSCFLSADHLQPGYAPPRGELPSLRAVAQDVQFYSVESGDVDVDGERRRASSVETQHTCDQPFDARVLGARYLTEGGREAERRVILMELALEGSGISYEPGDVIGVRCPNPVEATAYILERLQGTLPPEAGPNRSFQHSMRSIPNPCTLREAFTSVVDLQAPLRRPMLRALAEFCENAQERAWMELLCAKVSGADVYRNFVEAQSLTLCELLEAFPSCKPRPGPLLALLPPLPPRYYSVASSQLATPGSLTVAFSVVSHRLLIPVSTAGRGEGVTGEGSGENSDNPGTGDDRCLAPEEGGEAFLVTRRGLCTNWLEDMLKPFLSPGDGGGEGVPVVPVFMKPAKDFLLPASAKWPCVLIGPGTGVSPFIGFLKHREEQLAQRREMLNAVCSGYWRGSYEVALEGEEDETSAFRYRQGRGDMWLFFGCRNEKQDWIFRPEMEGFLSRGTLARLTTAFSRDTHGKVYVQDRIREAGEDLSRLMLEEGAYVYVCGDGNAMAQGVHRALVEVLAEHGGVGGKEGAERALRAMKERKSYVLDVWS